MNSFIKSVGSLLSKLLQLLCIALLLSAACKKEEMPAKDDPEVVRILAIGNSFSADAVEQNLYELITTSGQKCEIANLYIGGCSLERHVNNIREDAAAYEYRKVIRGELTNQKNVSIRQALLDGHWDFISVQQASILSGIYDSYQASLGELLAYVRRYCPKANIILHQTWAYAQTCTSSGFANYENSQQKMYDAIVDASSRVMQTYDIVSLVPSGTAIQNIRTVVGDQLNSDGTHLNTLGRYTAACTWFEALFGLDVRNSPYVRSDLSEDIQRIAKEAAHAAVQLPYAVTDIAAQP